MQSFTSLLLRAFYLTLLFASLLPLFLIVFCSSPTVQSWLIHMHWVNFPFPFLIDFHQPTKAQFFTNALACASYITTNSSTPLSGWLISPPSRCPSSPSIPPSSPPDQRCSSVPPFTHPVLYLHGNAENRAYRPSHARFTFLTAFPLCSDVFVFDYTGFADNPGSPTQAGLEEDARAMLNTVVGWDEAITPQSVTVYGHSLGSAVAIHLLHHLIAHGRPHPHSLIVEGAFTSVIENAMTYLPPPLDRWPWLTSVVNASLAHPWWSSSHVPLESEHVRSLFLHGTHDTEIPYWNAGKLWGQVVERSGCHVQSTTNEDGRVDRCGEDALVTVNKAHHYDVSCASLPPPSQ